jgi:hypothetical protein
MGVRCDLPPNTILLSVAIVPISSNRFNTFAIRTEYNEN